MAYKPRKDIKVSESYIQKLRDAGSKKAALDKYGSSTDPKMREALRRFYGASAPAPLTDSKRAKAANLPRKSVPMGKSVSKAKPSGTASRGPGQVVQTRRSAAPTSKAPNREAANKGVSAKSVGKKLDTFARNVYKYAGPENFIAGGAAVKAGKAVSNTAKSRNLAKNTRTAETATGSKKNLARTKVGYAKGLATKSEVKQAKAAVRSTTAQKVSSAARTGRDTAKYYGSAAKNTSTRTGRAMEMRSNQQAVAGAAKKKATSLKAAETRAKKATAAKRATKAGK